jgi:uncharacterized membrane protein YdbT with pleckstrin-like domain
MAKIPEKGLVYKTCRRSYFSNYILLVLVLILFVLVYLRTPYMREFALISRTPSQLTSTLLVLGFFAFMSFLLEEPTIERFIRQYHITSNEVMKVEGIISKKKIIIPHQSISGIKVNKSVVGRLLNYGSVEVHGFGNSALVMKGMNNPDEVYKIIENKVSQFRLPKREKKNR